jgi:hypothetical protein
MFSPSASSDDKDHKHHRHEAADFAEEQAETDQNTRSGLLGPRLGTGGVFGRTEVNDPTAAAEIRTSTNREDDGSKEMLIERERRIAEHGE